MGFLQTRLSMMLLVVISAVAALLHGAAAANHCPGAVTDVEILNFALNLEYLEVRLPMLRMSLAHGTSDADLS